MKSENIEPQNTQKYAEIYNGSREGQEKVSVSFRVVCGLKILNRRIRRNAQKYIMVQERDKKKVFASFLRCLRLEKQIRC